MTLPEYGKEESEEALASLRLSEKIHIMGFTREARYITHCLAGTPELPPPQLLAHQRVFVNSWGTSRRKLTVSSRDGGHADNEILIPQYIGKSRNPWRPELEMPRLKHIDNLIISTADNAIIPALMRIRDSINQDTTICVITPGLGIVEYLNKVIFEDPSTRPNFILGYSSHSLQNDPRNPKDPYSLRIRKRGRLLLSGLSFPSETESGTSEVATWERVARRARTQHFLKLLATVPGLDTTNLPMAKLLRYKLPPMIFSSIADAISVALGFPYERLVNDRYAQRLWRELWEETIEIISALPELKSSPEVLSYFTGHNFATEVNRYLRAQRGPSPWAKMVRNGLPLPIQGLNGWFVKKAEELGLSSVHHRVMMNMIRAKEATRKEELKSDIPLYRSSYMLDTDYLENDEEVPRQLVHVVYTNK
ncbi:hypothetical protein PFICI_02267 [Pestalotiopsis fici W106-1]|uniref:Ketopantoate reductase C-terminal domain-containing protein n=1 Tax=Pestalotiopsis fici (strain W106-1 / CGMCC3.15140) TaxID=1229662 RepID=W3XFR0_PESFW|nr:uncharacterized protein PFICI_02267 [Pestalotiopsis fici W106-1]ETS84242.1 hypothetical protein PFICI_02267 [Pestalotiopsis fici W106-1]